MQPPSGKYFRKKITDGLKKRRSDLIVAWVLSEKIIIVASVLSL